MKSVLSLFLVMFLFTGCKRQADPPSSDELVRVEKMFSDMSLSKGMSAAFNFYCAEEGVLLRPASMPIIGKDSVAAAMALVNDDLFTLTWKPIRARIAASGELGYTFGTYRISYKDGLYPDSEGTYVTIWEKNGEGEWRFLLDTGNDGLGEK